MSTLRTVFATKSAGDMCRKSIFVSFRDERLRMTTKKPLHTHREEILRRAWRLHAIFMVEMGSEVSIDGREEKSVVEIRFDMSRTSPFFGQVKDLSSIKKIESTRFLPQRG